VTAVFLRRCGLPALLLLAACASRPDAYSFDASTERLSRHEAERRLVERNLSVQVNPPLDAPLRLAAVTLPAYPPALKRRDKVPPMPVTVQFVVSENGGVSDASVVGAADPEVATVCVQALRLWRFEPLRRNGQPTTQRFRFQFLFQLED
jgi:TonB family protein